MKGSCLQLFCRRKLWHVCLPWPDYFQVCWIHWISRFSTPCESLPVLSRVCCHVQDRNGILILRLDASLWRYTPLSLKLIRAVSNTCKMFASIEVKIINTSTVVVRKLIRVSLKRTVLSLGGRTVHRTSATPDWYMYRFCAGGVGEKREMGWRNVNSCALAWGGDQRDCITCAFNKWVYRGPLMSVWVPALRLWWATHVQTPSHSGRTPRPAQIPPLSEAPWTCPELRKCLLFLSDEKIPAAARCWVCLGRAQPWRVTPLTPTTCDTLLRMTWLTRCALSDLWTRAYPIHNPSGRRHLSSALILSYMCCLGNLYVSISRMSHLAML